jgi:hypothetical protein
MATAPITCAGPTDETKGSALLPGKIVQQTRAQRDTRTRHVDVCVRTGRRHMTSSMTNCTSHSSEDGLPAAAAPAAGWPLKFLGLSTSANLNHTISCGLSTAQLRSFAPAQGSHSTTNLNMFRPSQGGGHPWIQSADDMTRGGATGHLMVAVYLRWAVAVLNCLQHDCMHQRLCDADQVMSPRT